MTAGWARLNEVLTPSDLTEGTKDPASLSLSLRARRGAPHLIAVTCKRDYSQPQLSLGRGGHGAPDGKVLTFYVNESLTPDGFVDILFRERKFEKQCNQQAALVRAHGGGRPQLIRARLDALRAAACLEDLRNVPGRLHELKGNRKGQLSFDLDHPYRLILISNHDPVPRTEQGGMDWERVTAIKILGIEDTHE